VAEGQNLWGILFPLNRQILTNHFLLLGFWGYTTAETRQLPKAGFLGDYFLMFLACNPKDSLQIVLCWEACLENYLLLSIGQRERKDAVCVGSDWPWSIRAIGQTKRRLLFTFLLLRPLVYWFKYLNSFALWMDFDDFEQQPHASALSKRWFWSEKPTFPSASCIFLSPENSTKLVWT